MNHRIGSSQRFILAALERAGIVINGPNPWDIRILDDRVFGRVAVERELGFGESYVDGWWECERIDELVARLLDGGVRGTVPPGWPALILGARSVVTNLQRSDLASRNASDHYGTHDRLLRHILGEPLLYSCAYWRHVESLSDAQLAKLDLIGEKLGLAAGMRVLDIGCGWGFAADYFASQYGVEVVGLTPVYEQAEFARKSVDSESVRIVNADFLALRHEQLFDRIYSIGMIEHVGPRNYRRFFSKCERSLTDDGLMLHQSIGRRAPRLSTDPWVDRHIFPGGAIPSLQQLTRAWSKSWVLEDLENLGSDYDLTLMAWLDGLEIKKDEVVQTFGEHLYRLFRFYFQYSAGAFRARELHLWQFVLSKRSSSSQYRRPLGAASAEWKPVGG